MKHLATLALVLLPLPALADEKDEALAKQRDAAAANWKKMAFKDAVKPIETANLIVYSRLPEAKTKALAASLEKIFTTALKPLKYDAKEMPWPGKMAVYILPDRSEFVEFMRKVIRKPLGDDDISLSNVSGDIVMVVVGASKAGDENPEDLARQELAQALLRRKLGGADPLDWLAAGFAQATLSRATQPTARAVSRPPLASFSYLWSADIAVQDKVKLATFLVDYLAYGPAADLFADFIGALRPGENGGTPSLEDAAKAIKLDPVSLEVLARNWKKVPTPRTPPKPKKP